MVGVPNGTSGLTTWDRFIYHTYEMECTCNAMDALEWIHRNTWNDGMMESNACMQYNGCIDQGSPPWMWHGGLPPQVPLVSDTTPSLKNILVQQESFFSTCPDHWVDL